IVSIAGLTVATIFFWVIFSIYQAVIKESDVVIEEAVLEEIDPTLDTTSLNALDTRVSIEEPELSSLVSSIESSVGILPEEDTGETNEEELIEESEATVESEFLNEDALDSEIE